MVECLAESGVTGLVVWFSVTLAGLLSTRRIMQLSRKRPEFLWCNDLARMAQVSVVAYLVGGTFLSLGYWDFYFTILGTVAATEAYTRRALADEMQPVRRRSIAALAPAPQVGPRSRARRRRDGRGRMPRHRFSLRYLVGRVRHRRNDPGAISREERWYAALWRRRGAALDDHHTAWRQLQ